MKIIKRDCLHRRDINRIAVKVDILIRHSIDDYNLSMNEQKELLAKIERNLKKIEQNY